MSNIEIIRKGVEYQVNVNASVTPPSVGAIKVRSLKYIQSWWGGGILYKKSKKKMSIKSKLKWF